VRFLQFLYYVIAIGSFCAGITAIILYGGGDDDQGYLVFLLCMVISVVFLGLAHRYRQESE